MGYGVRVKGRGRKEEREVHLLDDFGGDDFAGAAPGCETVEDHEAVFLQGFVEFSFAVERCLLAIDPGMFLGLVCDGGKTQGRGLDGALLRACAWRDGMR